MKATGIVRRVDQLGRISIPKEVRQRLSIQSSDILDVFMNDNNIYVRKHRPYCYFCNSIEDLTVFKGKNICAKCLSKITVLK